MQFQAFNRVTALLKEALQLSAGLGRPYVGVEYLFCAVLEHGDVLPPVFKKHYGSALMDVLRIVARTTWQGMPHIAPHDAFCTPRCAHVIQNATKLAMQHGHVAPNEGHVLLAILSDDLSAPSRVMDALDINRTACNALLLQELCATDSVVRDHSSVSHSDAITNLAVTLDIDASVALDVLLRDISQMARYGELYPAFGREPEIAEILQALLRQQKHHVMLVGESGVGKTQIIEGLPFAIGKSQEESPSFPSFTIIELKLAPILVDTAETDRLIEALWRIVAALSDAKDTILFIDDAHLLFEAHEDDSPKSKVLKDLKTMLYNDEVRCVGATREHAYRRIIGAHPALEQHFQMIRINKLSDTGTQKVLKRVVPSLTQHHLVRITPQAADAAVTLVERYFPHDCLPNKAIDILNQACARFSLKQTVMKKKPDALKSTAVGGAETGVTPHEVRKIVSRAAGVPIAEMIGAACAQLGAAKRMFNHNLIGQEEAVSRVVTTGSKNALTSNYGARRPMAVFLFAGPPGVGKTHFSRLLAAFLYGSAEHLVRFDMRRYADANTVVELLDAPLDADESQHEKSLLESIRRQPYSVLLLENIDKAHARILRLLLQMLTTGQLRNTQGRRISFRNCVIIMTVCVHGKALFPANNMDAEEMLMATLRQQFDAKLLNAVDDVIPFYPLLAEDIQSILRLEINALRRRIKEEGIGVRMYQRAYEYCIQKGFSPASGAHELHRLVETEITKPIIAMIKKNEVGFGHVINVMERDGRLEFNVGDRQADDKLREMEQQRTQ